MGDGKEAFDTSKIPDGNSNTEYAHEQLWFDDIPSDNTGFFAGDGSGNGPALCGENGKVRSDEGHSRDQYSFFGSVYDDNRMRRAVENI